ncbi:MAG: SH3 domain-containing protein [Chloroflexota bacterium]|nr:SH3 domain-containing protein [Chloroflexota bacterium]
MNFEEAEAKFRELQARVQRGEAISRAEYEEQVSQLAVQDHNGVLWEINPRTGKWMYFDGAEWVSGTPPGHDTSAVIPIPKGMPGTSAPAQPAFAAASSSPLPPARSTPPPVPSRPVTPPTASAPPAAKSSPEALKPYVRPQDKTAGASVTAATAPTGGGGKPPRASPLAMFGPNREWVPLAIGAVVLLLCAVLLIGVSQFVLPKLAGSQATPTRTLAPTLPATPLPTRVALPTLPPPTATPAPVLAKVIERTVNVRSGPSTKDKIVSTLKKDAQITLVGRNADSTWFQVNLAGQSAPGWVFGQTLQIVSGDANSLPVAGPTPTPTKTTAAPPAPKATATLAPLGTLRTPTPKPYP